MKIPAKRGLIRDRHGKVLVDNQPAYQLMLMRSDLRQISRTDPGHRDRMVRFVAATLGIPPARIEQRMDRGSDIPFNQPLPIAEDLTMPEVAEIEAHKVVYPAIYVETVHRRNYRYETMAAHVLGYMGEATQKDLDAHSDLRLGDLVGKKGVELVYDDYLRGVDGTRYMIVDSHGRSLSEYKAARKEPVPGDDIQLTIDFDLQRRAEQYFIEQQLVGSAVALDPRTGEVLAMVSSPMYNPNVYSRRFTPEVWKTILSNPFKLEVNRAIQGLYSPGSVFKVVMGMAGFENGVLNPSTSFHCAGSQVFYGRRFHCWKRAGHGNVNFEEGIKVSCDVFFYNVGARLGIDRIAAYAKNLGFGQLSRIDLTGEKAGLVPSEEWAREKQDRKWYPSETISVAIGQGPLLMTPLQVADMMAAVANGNKVMRPHVLRMVSVRHPDGSIGRKKVVPEVLHQTHLEASALKAMRQGLWEVVNAPGGTGGRARIEGLDICGKTGTVQVIAQSGSPEQEPFKYRDHAWFASFAPRDNPRLVVVVFVEHGGHGGSGAAPLAKELYEAYFARDATRKTISLENPETLKNIERGRFPKPETEPQ